MATGGERSKKMAVDSSSSREERERKVWKVAAFTCEKD